MVANRLSLIPLKLRRSLSLLIIVFDHDDDYDGEDDDYGDDDGGDDDDGDDKNENTR